MAWTGKNARTHFTEFTADRINQKGGTDDWKRKDGRNSKQHVVLEMDADNGGTGKE